jgi:hypothetical protein
MKVIVFLALSCTCLTPVARAPAAILADTDEDECGHFAEADIRLNINFNIDGRRNFIEAGLTALAASSPKDSV